MRGIGLKNYYKTCFDYYTKNIYIRQKNFNFEIILMRMGLLIIISLFNHTISLFHHTISLLNHIISLFNHTIFLFNHTIFLFNHTIFLFNHIISLFNTQPLVATQLLLSENEQPTQLSGMFNSI